MGCIAYKSASERRKLVRRRPLIRGRFVIDRVGGFTVIGEVNPIISAYVPPTNFAEDIPSPFGHSVPPVDQSQDHNSSNSAYCDTRNLSGG